MRAAALEEIIVRGAAIEGDDDFDLRFYILGSPEQAAVAVATLMQRVEDDPADSGSQPGRGGRRHS